MFLSLIAAVANDSKSLQDLVAPAAVEQVSFTAEAVDALGRRVTWTVGPLALHEAADEDAHLRTAAARGLRNVSVRRCTVCEGCERRETIRTDQPRSCAVPCNSTPRSSFVHKRVARTAPHTLRPACSPAALNGLSSRAHGRYTIGDDGSMRYELDSCKLPLLPQQLSPPRGSAATRALRVLFVGDSLVEELAVLVATHAGYRSAELRVPRRCSHASSLYREFHASGRSAVELVMRWSAHTNCRLNFEGLPMSTAWHDHTQNLTLSFRPDVLVLSIPVTHLLYRCLCEKAALCPGVPMRKDRGPFCTSHGSRVAAIDDFVASVARNAPNATLVFAAVGATFDEELEAMGIICNAEIWRLHQQSMQLVRDLRPRSIVLNLFEPAYSFAMASRVAVGLRRRSESLIGWGSASLPKRLKALEANCERVQQRHCSCVGSVPLAVTEEALSNATLRPLLVRPPCEAALRMLIEVLNAASADVGGG
mmetsp:Transcript_52012/g.119663  ORF Transcript_52012/g.119663 Transcript_52012/m.119663 type:complete len:480 (-) Transcript_52012:289-1728(-)|eukprot:CAMPEP_0119352130 /NCGR_PEP_ID=MMETSP1334-20130426/1448_1 /TAXON_ID=127549 /ORGANISM="Calcidiscus leptoporus, Strain RCC1130" /LENGTH=479 /DNA_ID=CAMNT_0007365101 /DNA_START=221 /DNA_END=1660 /DNA_ORIENTATION=+